MTYQWDEFYIIFMILIIMSYRAALFDLDGTLVHTMPEYRYQIVGNALRDLGTTAPDHYIDKFWFEARRNDIIRDCFGVDPELFWAAYQRYDIAELRRALTRPYDDTDVIQELRKRGYRTGIVTGAPLHIASLEIEMLGKDNFDAVVNTHCHDGLKPKPYPHGIEKCMRLLCIGNNEALYVGNSDEDIMAARNANVLDVLVLRNEHEFPHIKPSVTISSLYELRQLLE